MSDFDFRFDYSEMKTLQNVFKSIAVPSFQHSLLQEMGQAALDLIEQQFINSRDPYGRRWPDRKKNQVIGIYRVLYKTGALAHRIRVKINNDSLELISLVDYFIVHQHGAPRAHIPQRLIFPEELIGLPERWIKVFDGIAQTMWRNILVRAAFG